MSSCTGLPNVLAEKCLQGVQFYERYKWLGLVLVLGAGAVAIRIAIEKRRAQAINHTLQDQGLGVGRVGESYIYPKWRIKRKWLFGPATALVIKFPAGKKKEQIDAAGEALAACLGGGVSFNEAIINDLKVVFTVRNHE